MRICQLHFGDETHIVCDWLMLQGHRCRRHLQARFLVLVICALRIPRPLTADCAVPSFAEELLGKIETNPVCQEYTVPTGNTLYKVPADRQGAFRCLW